MAIELTVIGGRFRDDTEETKKQEIPIVKPTIKTRHEHLSGIYFNLHDGHGQTAAG